MDELQKLYDVLVREGKYTKSFEEFQAKWGQDQAYKDKVFDVVSRDGLYTKDKNSFLQKYSGGGLTPQTPEQPIAQPTQPIQPEQGPMDFKKKGQSPFGVAALPSAPSFLESQKQLPTFETTPLIGAKPKPKAKQPLDFLEPSLQTITPELINKNEEFVVPKMNYQFADLGFKFEESGATGDWMTATAPNGKTIEVSLDPFFSSKAVSESEKLKKFIKDNSAQVKGLSTIERSYAAENKKFDTQKEVDESIKKVNNDATTLNQEMGSFLKQRTQLETEYSDLSKVPQALKNSPEYIAKSQAVLQKQKDLEAQRQQLISRQNKIETESKYLDKAVGKYANMKSQQGTFLGGTWNWLLEGASSIAAGAASSVIDLGIGLLPKDMLMAPEEWKSESLRIAKELKIGEPSIGQSPDKWLNSLTQTEKDKIESKIRDLGKKQVKADVLPAVREGNRVVLGDPTTTTEWTRLKEEGFWGGAYAGVMKSLPAMVNAIGGGLPGRALTTAAFYAQVSDGVAQEMEKNPAFKDISENEKNAVMIPIGITGAVLEELGLRNVVGSKGLLNKLALRALGKAGATTTATTFKELVQNEVESMIAKGALTLTAAGLAEAETGAAQQIAEYGVKDIYNAIKGTKMFNNPETFTAEWVKDVAKAGAQEAVGGFIMGMPTAVSTAYTKKGFLNMSDITFRTFESAANDENIQKAFVTKLKNQVNQGEITMEQAKTTLNNYRNSVGLFKSMPENLDIEGKKNAMNLLKEKKDLENQIINKDPALVKPQKDRINAINESLTKLSEDAIQKQAANESLLLSQQSEMGLQQVGEGDQGLEVTTTGTEETITPQGTQETITQTTENGQPTTATTGPIAGNRLFNKPLTAAKEVANRYYQRVFGTERPSFAGTRKLDEARGKRIADAYIAMKDDPTNPEVRAAYDAMAKETLDQYKDFVDSGFTIEVDNEEPYANSQEMIDDLRNNNRIKIFATEAGFGSNPITEEQRQRNPLLQDSGFKDAKGNTLLVNDVFRAIHDFYGHAELGNSFGPKGEENAWNIHARMFSPLARRAMTTETRGQNSYVNFSGVNEKIDKLREEARKLREQGDEEGAKLIVDKIYQEGLFADQKIGLLPEEFSQFDEADAGDVTMRPQGLQERDMTETQVGEFEAKAKKLAEDIENFQIPSWFSATLPEGTKTSGITAEDFKKLVAKSVVEIGKLMDRGVEFAAAVKEAVKDLVDLLGEDKRDKIEQTVKEYFNKGEGVSENELPGYDALNSKVDAMIETQNKKKVDAAKIEKNVMKLVQQSAAYKNATDVQKEKLVREARKKLGLKEKSAPSVARLKTEAEAETEGQSLFQKFFGAVKKDAKVTMTEKNLLKKQIKDLARGARDAKSAWMKVSNELSKGIKELTTRGTISDTQAKNVLRKFSKVNMFSQKSIDSFIDYMTKVFANAEYSSKLSQANSLKKDISKFSKDKNKNANLRDMAQQFVKIDPSMVEDIDAYNEMAAKIKEAIKGSTIRGEKVTFANTVNIENASEYIAKTLAAQDEKIRLQKAEEIQDLMGVDVSELSYDDMMQLLDSKEPITKYNEGIIRDTIQKMFDIYSSIINATIDTGKDQFNDEDVEFTKKQKALVKRFMDMDLSLLKPKEALQAVDALGNFLQNHSTAKMETVLSEYTANFNLKKLAEKGIVAQPLKKYWSERFGRYLGEQTTNLNILFEKMFKGFNRGGEVEDAMGVTKLKNNKSMGEREANNIVDKYVSQFYKKKANGEAYNSEYNSVERGLAAFMMRNVIGTAKQMESEFNRRKELIKESIKVLSQGNDQEQRKSELYQKVYDKILKDANSIQEIKDNTDVTNLEGIDFWNKEWADKYEQLSDVAENVYNKVLDKDLNYTPDKFVKLSSETGDVELSNDDSAFFNNSDGVIYKKETGVLMTAVKPETLPTNPKSGQTSMYIDLSFDKNNANAMYDALIDMGTAAPIRQIEAFLNSPDFRKIVPKSEDAKILKNRVQLYVGNIRNKNPYSNDELSAVVRSLNKIASIGVGQALGGVLQPFKQVIPVAMNTLVNAGGLDMGAMFSAAKNGFINRAGYAISNRGIESQAQVESLNKLIDEASKSKGAELLKKVEKLNKWWLEKFLVNPDVFIARASWMTYYEQSLNKQGIDTKGIDYNTHEVNEEAADYAQRMVDRQQNVSDADLSGKMFSNKESSNQLLVKTLLPFASFRMNQSARLGADLAVLSDKTATEEDKKIALRSLSGFAVEMVTFKIVAAGSAILLGSAAKWALGQDEDDEERKKRINNVIKGQVTSTFTDIMSPLPILDKAYQKGGNFLTESLLGIPKESVFSIYNVPKQDYFQSLGLFGIAADRASQLYDISKLSATGEYTDDFGKVKQISESDRQALSVLIAPAILSNLGLAPVEANSIVRNAIKYAKKGEGKSSEETGAKQERADKKADETSQKIDALDKLREKAKSQDEMDAIDEKISVLEATPEEKKAIAEDNKAEKELKRDLLTDPDTGEEYDNESELKRYNPKLYNQNFGPQSEWYQDHKDEKEIQKKLNKEIRKMEDIEEGYVAPVKTKRTSRRNSDGTIKSSTFKRVRKDANGNVISSFTSTKN